jgi:hypothetical protein
MLLASSVPLGVPAPPAVVPVPPPVLERDGGGGTTLGAPSFGAVDEYMERLPVPPSTPVEGGGATTFEPRDVPAPLRVPRGVAVAAPVTVGGGATTAGWSEAAVFDCVLVTAGGGGTTSDAPKSFPTRLLSNDPLLAVVGGGGTTDLEGSAVLPVARRRMSCVTSVDGGGAITEGAGMVSLGLRVAVRSGAEAGGGTTAGLVICSGELEISRLTAAGAGAITFDASDGVEREGLLADWLFESVGAGATTD